MGSNPAYPPLAVLKGEAQRKVGTMLLNDLKVACGKEGLTKAGRKSELQDRLLGRLALLNDQVSVARLIQSLGGSHMVVHPPSASSPYIPGSEMSHRWRESPFYKVKK